MNDSDEVQYFITMNEGQSAYTLDIASTGFISYQELAACLIDFANTIKDDEKSVFGEIEKVINLDN